MARQRSAAGPVSLLNEVRGFSRDFPIDALPQGYVWDVCDFVLNRRGVRLAWRSGYKSLGAAFPAASTGGLNAVFSAGAKLIMESAGVMYDVAADGSRTAIGNSGFSLVQNGTLLNDRAYFFGSTPGASTPWYGAWAGSWAQGPVDASAPKGTVGITYKGRIVVSGTGDNKVYFSPSATTGGPLGAWDTTSVIGTSNKVNGLAAMASQILVFHDGSIERIRGTQPPVTNAGSGDMYVDTLSEHVGCPFPASICHWQENVLFADPNGVQMTDGAAIRCLTDQGGLHSYWLDLYRNIRAGQQVRCEVFADQLVVFVPSAFTSTDTNRIDYPTLLICDLNNRTWSRFSNVYPSCLIPIVSGTADIVWCGDGYGGSADLDERAITPSPLKLSHIASMFLSQDAKDPGAAISLAQQYDGDGDPVLPHLETGWSRLGGDTPKQFDNLYVSHVLQVDESVAMSTPVMRAAFTTEPLVSYMAGDPAFPLLPNNFYTRDRFQANGAGYGIRVALDAVAPVGAGGIYDIQVDVNAKDPVTLR